MNKNVLVSFCWIFKKLYNVLFIEYLTYSVPWKNWLKANGFKPKEVK